MKKLIEKTRERIEEKKEYVEQNDLIPALSVSVLIVGIVGIPICVLVGLAISSIN